MTTTTPKLSAASGRGGLRGYTLVEIMVSTGLSAIVLAAILSSFLYIGRASASMTNYADMEVQARNAMEAFAQDVRMASDATWNSAQSLTLKIERSGASTNVTYAYDATNKRLTRTLGSGGTAQVIVTNISSFSYYAYTIDAQSISLSNISAATNRDTKQVQISLETRRSQQTVALATNKVISARFVLRNKHVT